MAKTRIYEADFLRPILIVMLVLYHCLSPFSGNWPPFNGFSNIIAYWWVGKFSYSIFLEAFTFVSGYLYAYQLSQKEIHLKDLALNKFKRLYLPALLFSFVDVFLFGTLGGGIDIVRVIVFGADHLWYLPMLFYLFLISHVILLKFNNIKIILLVLLLLAILSLPVRGLNWFYYLFFFILGVFVLRKKPLFIKYINKRNVVVVGVLYLATFFLSTPIISNLESNSNLSFYCRILYFCICNILRLVFSSLGLIFFYFLSIRFVNKYRLPYWIVKISSLCFGIYIFHSFIITGIYYYSEIPSIINNNYYLPWLVFIIALPSSALIANIIKNNKVTKNLL